MIAALAVDPNIELPPYQQIAEQLRAFVQRGELAPDTLLPTVRQLAGDLNVAPNTVARAYADLQQEGWLIGDGRRGTRVASRIPSADKRVRTSLLRESLRHALASLAARGYGRAEILAELRKLAAE